MISPLPESTLRLFEDLPPECVGRSDGEAVWVGRILEEGEEADLRWLSSVVDEDRLKRWWNERGGRQLSRRSRAFWRLLLDGRTSPPASSSTMVPEQLWLL